LNKNVCCILAAFGLWAMTATATPITCGGAPAGDNTVGYYATNNITCDVGNVQFSNFGYVGTANPSGDVIPGTSIGISAVAGGLAFSSGWSVVTQGNGSSSFEDSTVSFTVTGINGYEIDDLGLGFNGVVTGNGSASVAEAYCLGTTVPVATCGSPSTPIKVTDPPPTYIDGVTFSPVTSLTVSKDIDVTSGTDFSVGNLLFPSSADISTVVNEFSVVDAPTSTTPEPGTSALIGLGLLACSWIGGRKKKA
jgi:hypothetical protein